MCSDHERYGMRGLIISHLITDTLIKAIKSATKVCYQVKLQYFIASNINAHVRLKLEIKNFNCAPFPFCEPFLITCTVYMNTF